MISKKVDISPKNDNYARLAEYIADAGHEGEKSLMRWCAGCLGDDDYQNGIAEAMDVQSSTVQPLSTRMSSSVPVCSSVWRQAIVRVMPSVARGST